MASREAAGAAVVLLAVCPVADLWQGGARRDGRASAVGGARAGGLAPVSGALAGGGFDLAWVYDGLRWAVLLGWGALALRWLRGD